MLPLDQRQEHGELFCSTNGMRQIGWHVEHLTALHQVYFAREGELTFARENLDERVLHRSMFGQFLAFGETKQHDP